VEDVWKGYEVRSGKRMKKRVEEWRREALRIAKRLKARPVAPPEEWDEYA
jgi:hypothetical protein